MVAYSPGSTLSRETVVQPIAWVRDQLSKPSCCGQAFAAGVDALGLSGPPWASAVDLWRDARRRQRNLENVLAGTRAEYVIESLIRRGWSPYKPSEDSRPMSDDDNAQGSLLDELKAHDTRQLGAVHYAIVSDRVDRTIDALRRGAVVCGGWGLREPFYTTKPGQVVSERNMNAMSNGHEMRIFAYDADREAFALQNSWGRFWCSAEINGIWYPGCCLISEEALEAAWDIDVIELVDLKAAA
jgi:hypothetical protein